MRSATSHHRATVVACVLWLFGTLLCVPAFAQETATSDDVSELATGAAQDFAAERYEAAHDKLSRLYEVAPTPNVQYNLARTKALLHRCDEARATFDAFLARPEISDEDRELAAEQLAALQHCGVAKTTFECAHPGTVRFGDLETTCGATVDIKQGSYTAQLLVDDEVRQSLPLEVVAPEPQTVSFTWTPPPVVQPPPPRDPSPVAEVVEPAHADPPGWAWPLVGAGAATIIATFAVVEYPGKLVRKNKIESGDTEGPEKFAKISRPLELGLFAAGVAMIGGGIVGLQLERSPDETTVAVTWTATSW